MNGVFAGVWAFFQALSYFIAHCGIRLILWALAIAIAMFPSLHAAGLTPSTDIQTMADHVNNVGFFRDFFFIVVVCGILGLSNILYTIIMRRGSIHIWSALAGTACMAYFAYILVYGTTRFVEIAKLKLPVPTVDLGHDLDTIRNVLILGIFTEIIVAFSEQRA